MTERPIENKGRGGTAQSVRADAGEGDGRTLAVRANTKRLSLVPTNLSVAKNYVRRHHRHNKPPQSGLFSVGLELDGELVGVAIAGRPVARALDDGRTVEVTRVCTAGHKNANSKLYGAILRAAKALGYWRAYTYTLASESGASMRAVGFRRDAELAPRPTWNCPARDRYQTDLFGEELRPAEAKVRWIWP